MFDVEPQLTQRNAQLAFLVNCPPESALAFKNSFHTHRNTPLPAHADNADIIQPRPDLIDVQVATDPTRVVYRHLGLTRGCFHVFLSGHFGALNRHGDWVSQRFVPNAEGATNFPAEHNADPVLNNARRNGGDGLQNGGVLVMSPTGDILLHHANQFTGDHLAPEAVLAAIDSHRAPADQVSPAP